MSDLRISWTIGGGLAVDDIAEDQPMLEVKFFDSWSKLTPEKKIRLLRALCDRCLPKEPQT